MKTFTSHAAEELFGENGICRRVFGTTAERPCNDPNVIECRMWECQSEDKCQRQKPLKS